MALARTLRHRNGAPHSYGRFAVLMGALLLLAVNLRLIFPSLSVLLPELRAATGLSTTLASYLTMLPVLCLGVFSPLAPWSARRIGIERTLLATLLILAAGTALRGVFGMIGLFIGSALAGGSIAVANVLLPALVKRDFSRHVAGVTGVYTMMLNAGASVAAATTLPLTHAVGRGWSLGVMVWAIPPLIAAGVWATVYHRRHDRHAPKNTPPRRGLWGSPLAWQVTLFMGLQSATAYCVVGWLAPILRARGLDGTTAGVVTSVCVLMNAVGSLCAPPLLKCFRDQRGVNVAMSIVTGGSLAALVVAPLSGVWLWAVLQGLAQGAMFATALTVIVLRSPDSQVAAQLSSMAQTFGYMLAAMGPLLVGLLFSWTGSFYTTAGLFVLIAGTASLTGWRAGRAVLISLRAH